MVLNNEWARRTRAAYTAIPYEASIVISLFTAKEVNSEKMTVVKFNYRHPLKEA